MNVSLKMNEEQIKTINNFISSSGECWCGEKLTNGDRKALLSQPFSYGSTKSGTMVIAAICQECFEEMTHKINGLKLKSQDPK